MAESLPLGVVFDIDDTLFLERDYVKSGFRAVAQHAAGFGVVSAEEAFALLWDGFLAGVRGSSFNALLEAFPQLAAHFEIPELVAIYREHKPDIVILPEMLALLQELKAAGAKLGAISDGPLASQDAKAAALKVAAYCDPVILTDALGREYWKPHRKAFEMIARAWGLPPGRLVYIGDNPSKDFHAPHDLGWASIRFRVPEQVRYDMPHDEVPPSFEATSVAQVRAWLLQRL